jgi:hypothetical protein
VKEAVDAMKDPPFTVVAPILPNGRGAIQHLAISDPSGDSAIFEYLGGKRVIHHGPQYKVLTNSPPYDQELALNAYWGQIGGNRLLPGTISATDRFVRLSYNLKSSPKYKDERLAVASVFSQMRAIGVPLGMADPNHPNISMSLWRTVADQGTKVGAVEGTPFFCAVMSAMDQSRITTCPNPAAHPVGDQRVQSLFQDDQLGVACCGERLCAGGMMADGSINHTRRALIRLNIADRRGRSLAFVKGPPHSGDFSKRKV